jgi:hypothetical protein
VCENRKDFHFAKFEQKRFRRSKRSRAKCLMRVTWVNKSVTFSIKVFRYKESLPSEYRTGTNSSYRAFCTYVVHQHKLHRFVRSHTEFHCFLFCTFIPYFRFLIIYMALYALNISNCKIIVNNYENSEPIRDNIYIILTTTTRITVNSQDWVKITIITTNIIKLLD